MHRASFRAPRMLCMLPCIAVAIALTIATGEIAHAQPASTRRIPYAATPALQPTERPVSAVLAQIEQQLTALEASNSDLSQLSVIESEVNLAYLRATTASERIQARRLLRRAKRIHSGLPPLKPQVAQTSYQVAPASATDAGQFTTDSTQFTIDSSQMPPASVSPSSPLAPLAAVAARLAQYGAPVAQPGCETPVAPLYSVAPMAPAPVAVAVCPPPPRHWVNFDALGWWMKGDSLPALVSSSPGNTPLDQAGILGLPTTTVLFGNEKVNDSLRWGGRVQGGVWLDDFQTFAVEGHYYGFPTVTTSFSATSVFSDGTTDDPILARPYFATAPGTNVQSAVLIAAPGFVIPPFVINADGTINVEEKSSFQSAGLGGRFGMFSYSNPLRAFLLGGYRFIDLNESLTIVSSSSATLTPLPFPIPDDGTIEIVDQFTTRNIFNGGEIGLAGEYVRSRWSFAVVKRLALGSMNQQVSIKGRTSALYENYAASYEGGVLAQPTNIGTFTQNKFAWIPELDLKLGYQVLPKVRLTVGYNLTYISSVVRPGGQVDTNVNMTQIAGLPLIGPPDPAVTMDTTSVWLQGFTTGIDMRF